MLVRHQFYLVSIVLLAAIAALSFIWFDILTALYVVVPLILLGIYDILQTKNNILRNYPVIGHLRQILQSIRPEIQQYFIQRDTEKAPFSREQWELINERSTKSEDALPFGTLLDVYEPGYSWVAHSIMPRKVSEAEARITVGNSACKQPYIASRLNISAMSYGALSSRAVRALNRGAKLGGFAQNTGEGGLTPYHLQEGGDLVWQIGTGYFGARTLEGNFCREKFKEKASHPQVKMIELKLSQGAKPGHGGLLPAAKVSEEIATIRGIPANEDCLSPGGHSAFSTPIEMMQFIAELRELSGGKPVGFKLCIGVFTEFMAICKAMIKTGIKPDFITVDGGEGGTGAAPAEFTDSVGAPLNEGLSFVDSCLRGAGLRSDIKIIASGKVTTGFDLLSKIALGADMCNAARPMLFAIGCVQSRTCHTNKCPTGVTTQDKARERAINVAERAVRVHNYHQATMHNFHELLAATGLGHPDEICRSFLRERVNFKKIARYGDIYPIIEEGIFLNPEGADSHTQHLLGYWNNASAEKFQIISDK